jgi:hypothetical protein
VKLIRLAPLNFVLAALIAAVSGARAQPAAARATLIIVEGAAGESEFATEFHQQTESWRRAGVAGGVEVVTVGVDAVSAAGDREDLRQAITRHAVGETELWLVLIGHGTFDGREAKFNLRGPDVSDAELAEWLRPVTRPLAVIDTTAASAPFLAKLAARNRVVVTATRSGNEHNYARFGRFMAAALTDAAADLDRDGQVSLLEAFLAAAQRTQEFYAGAMRLATEHALLDDNGDGLGTPADWFKGVRATRRAKDGAPADGPRAHQFHLVRSVAEQQLSPDARRRRDELELDLAQLRETKRSVPGPAYEEKLRRLLLELAALYAETDPAR